MVEVDIEVERLLKERVGSVEVSRISTSNS